MSISYTVIRSRRRTITLVVGRDATITVRAPYGVANSYIETLLSKKQIWITRKQGEMKERPVLAEKKFRTGELFLLLGVEYRLNVCDCTKISLDYTSGEILFPQKYLTSPKVKMAAWYRQQASDILSSRLRSLSEKTGLRYVSMKITSAQSRWGSCSGENTINFSWRLIMARPSAIEYVILHELTHTVHHNHSSAFWSRLIEVFPHYQVEELWLKKHSERLRL